MYRPDTVMNVFGISGPQADSDRKAAYILNQIPRQRVEDPNIAELARLIIRYNYPEELIEIADRWGFTVNTLMSAAMLHWQVFERLSAATATEGSNWDVSAEEL